MATAKILK